MYPYSTNLPGRSRLGKVIVIVGENPVAFFNPEIQVGVDKTRSSHTITLNTTALPQDFNLFLRKLLLAVGIFFDR